MRLLICGGRNWGYTVESCWTEKDVAQWQKALYLIEEKVPDYIISGAAKGADELGPMFRIMYGVNGKEYPAKWGDNGKAAGPIRNQQMLDEGKPDMVMAFKGGTGTADMVKRAKKADVPVVEVLF